MSNELNGRRVAILAAKGVEQVELVQPRDAVVAAGAEVTLVSLQQDDIQAMNGDINPADTFPVDKTVGQTSADDYDALIIPGGTVNPDTLRQDTAAVSFASFPSIRTDLANAGANVVDQEVVVDNGLVTSRSPADLDAFCTKIVAEFVKGNHAPAVSA